MLEAALDAEVEHHPQRHRQQRNENGHALVGCNGRAQEQTVHCRAGQLKLRSPRVHDKRELYLRGLSTGDFQQALSAWLGEEAIAGFSATTITRLLFVWQDEYKAWRKRHWPLPMAP